MFKPTDEVEINKPGDANHGREGRIAREVTPTAPAGPWPTRKWEIAFEDGQEKAEYPEFCLRPVKAVTK